MGFKKGNPGKPKGAKNLLNRSVEETAQKLGLNLFESLCLYAKGDWKALGYQNEVYVTESAKGEHTLGYTIPPELRLKAIESACKYLYSPKQAVEVSGTVGLKLIIEDYTTKK